MASRITTSASTAWRREPTADERALAGGLAAREPRALEELERRYGRLLHGYLTDVLADAETARDVAQQVLVEVWQRGPTYDPQRASLSTWLLTIARSRAVDHRRRRIAEPRDLADLAHEPVADPPEDVLLERWRVGGLLERLPRQEAEILRLRFYAELPQTEIAERTGLPLGTVKMRMVAALSRLRELLAEEAGA